MTPEDEKLYRARQKSNARVLAILLGTFAVLVFFITIARIKAGMPL